MYVHKGLLLLNMWWERYIT